MPYTRQQQKMFHARCQQGDQKMCELAKEADHLPTKPDKKTDWKKEHEKMTKHHG